MKEYIILKNGNVYFDHEGRMPIYVGFSLVRETIRDLKKRFENDSFTHKIAS